MQRYAFYLLIAFLLFLGLGIAIYRHLNMGIPWTPGQDQIVWSIDAEITFAARGEPAKVSLARPMPQKGYSLANETAASPGYGVTRTEEGGEVRLNWAIREARGRQTLYYNLLLVEKAQLGETQVPTPTPPEPVVWEEPYQTAANSLVEKAWQKSADAVSMAHALIHLITRQEPDQSVELLLTQTDPTQLVVKLLQQAGYPAILSYGLELEDGRRGRELTPLVEVHDGKRWYTAIVHPEKQALPERLMLWQRGARSLIDVTGGSNARVRFSMVRETRPLRQLLFEQFSGTPWYNLTLYSLPIEEQAKFKGLLLIPIGTLVVVFLRVLVGLRTSGTFMPVLIALAFQQTELVTGVVGLLLVVSVGLVIRQLLSNINLLLVSRIAATVVVVISIIALFTIFSYRIGLTEGMKITFFPMIILAWTIERMSILWEEEGPREVAVQGAGSLIVAILAYLSMQDPLIRHLSFNFPELMLIELAVIMLLGQYTGYRLLELRRFLPMSRES